jgi:hypothetical protein
VALAAWYGQERPRLVGDPYEREGHWTWNAALPYRGNIARL